MKRKTRGTYLGGHEISAVYGVHPYMNAGDVFAACALGQARDIGIPDDDSRPSVLRRGKLCEPGLIDHIGARLGETLARDVHVIDPAIPFFAGTIDAAGLDGDGYIDHVHEITVTSTRALESWGEDGDPGGAQVYKWVQCQWYQGISGASGGTVWLFVADTGEIRRYPCDRNADAISDLRRAGEDFWLNHVLTKTPPDVAGDSVSTWAVADSALSAIYGIGNGQAVDATPEIVAAALDYQAAHAEMRTTEEKKRAASARIKAELRDASSARWETESQRGSVHWKRNKPRLVTEYDRAFADLADEVGVDEKKRAEILRRNTQAKTGARYLRVYVNEKKEKE